MLLFMSNTLSLSSLSVLAGLKYYNRDYKTIENKLFIIYGIISFFRLLYYLGGTLTGWVPELCYMVSPYAIFGFLTITYIYDWWKSKTLYISYLVISIPSVLYVLSKLFTYGLGYASLIVGAVILSGLIMNAKYCKRKRIMETRRRAKRYHP